jgi:hypothetical protein
MNSSSQGVGIVFQNVVVANKNGLPSGGGVSWQREHDHASG